jgi:hypothetical protein
MRYVMLCLCGLLAAGVDGAPIIIDHASIDAVAALPAEVMAKAGRLTWFFAHASVGDNIMDGITDWHSQDTNRYPLQRVEYFGHDAPPTDMQPGVIYDHMRWNPGWQAKITMFETNVAWYWHAPRVQVAMNKLGYVDPDADPDAYLASMQNLQAQYPTTAFVYMTMCMTADGDRFEVQRNRFNDKVRSWVAAHDAILFDIADIESHSPPGDLATFTFDGATYPLLYAPYSIDGGHLNAPDNVGRQRAALGFYALSAALFTTDRNGDGISDGDNLLQGTSPITPVTSIARPELRLNPGVETGTRLALLWVTIDTKGLGDVSGYLEWYDAGSVAKRQPFPTVLSSTNPAGFPLVLTGLSPGVAYTAQLAAISGTDLTLSAPVVFSTLTQSVTTAAADWVDRPAGLPVVFPVDKLLANDRGVPPLSLEWFSSISTLGASVSIHGTNLEYEPIPGGDSVDTFFYVVAGATGEIDGAWVTIMPLSPVASAPLSIRNIVGVRLNGAGGVTITCMGIPGQMYTIQTTDSLNPAAWQTTRTVQASVSGEFTFKDSQPSSAVTHYYRAVQF